jgi:DNA-binding transcriptional ArsR family regulator
MTIATREAEAGVDPRLIKTLSHPLRQRLFIALNQKVSSPAELAKSLDEPLSNVSYHVKILAQCDAIELVKTTQIRGATEHFYRATARHYFDDSRWVHLPLSMRRALFGQTLQQIWEHVVQASAAGGFDNLRDHVSWTTPDLDEEGYQDMVDHVNAALERALQIQEESANRRATQPPDSGEIYRTEFVLMHFHRPPDVSS